MKLLRIAVAVGVFLVFLEIFARIEDRVRWGASLIGNYNFQQLRYIDETGMSRCRPNAHYKHFRLDDDGFRVTGASEVSGPSVAWIGASEAFGLYESPGNDIAALTQKALAPRIKVLNASCFGQNLLRIRTVLETTLSDHAISALAISPTPHFYLDLDPVEADRPRVRGRARPMPRLASKFRDVLKSFLPSNVQSYMRKWQIDRIVESSSEPDWYWKEIPLDRLALFESHLRKVIVEARKRTQKIAILTHGNAFSGVEKFDRGQLIAWQKFYPRAGGTVLIDFDIAANAVIRDLSSEYQLELIDAELLLAGCESCFADFSHFTDLGAEILASSLISFFENAEMANPL